MNSNAEPSWPLISDDDWDRLDGIRMSTLMDGFWCPVLSAQDDCDRLTERRREGRFADLIDWAGRGFTVRNDESTT